MKKIYSFIVFLLVTLVSVAQLPTLPLDFESTTVNYTFTDFDGGATTKIANPQINGINTSANVARMIKSAGQPWGGSWIEMAAPIDFSVNKTFKVKVYSPRVGAKLLLKVENATNPALNFEKEATSTVANAWEELTFDYTTINTANAYHKIVFIFDNGTMGNGTANFTFLIDDVRLTTAGGGGGGGGTLPTLPLDFESTTVNYAFTDFDGGATTKIANPQINGINTSANVARMIKSAGQPWGGSLIQMAAPIDFSVNKTFKVKVYSPRVGAKLLLKVENATNPALNFEKEATSTVANAWEELTFDYSTINTANAYHKIVFIFDNGTMGNGTANFTFLIDDVRLTTAGGGGGGGTLPTLPLDFESTTVNYAFTDFDGGATTKIANPQINGINTSANVARMIKSAGQPWGGSLIQMAAPIDFSVNKTFKVKVYSPRVGAKLLLKVENATNPALNFEKEATSTVANAWEELTFDYTTINTANAYHKIVFIFDNGTMGNGTANFTFLIDDVRLTTAGGGGGGGTLPTLPLDFESTTVNYAFTDFDGGATTKIANPQINGINTSANVARMIKSAGQPWGGSWIQMAAPIDFSVNKTFKVKVYSPRVGAKLLLKVENATNPVLNFEKEATSTVANAWEELTFDYSTINTANAYHKIVFIFDNGTMGNGTANFTFLIDDVRLTTAGGGGGGGGTLPTLPLDFESTTLNYAFTDFDGGATTKIANPQINGINTSANVARMVKSAGQPWGGSWIQLAGPMDFSVNKIFKVKVYSPRIGAKLLLKVENETNPAIFYEKEATSTVANAWEELTFDCATINTANAYHKLIFIFDNGTMGNGSANFTFLLDDVRLTTSGGPVLTLPVLPLDFESSTITYSFTNFDGGATTKIANPQINGINTSANVARMVKSAGQPWGGSWLLLASPINFSTNKIFKVKVFSPRVGAKLLLKAENEINGAQFYELEVLTTVANAWEELTFDFSAINTANTYSKLVFIFDNGTMGNGSANFTWLFDDVRLVTASGPTLTQMNVPVTFDDATVNYGLVGFGGAEQSTIVTDPTLATNKVAKVIKTNTAELWAGTTLSALLGITQTSFANAIPFTTTERRMNVRVWSPHTNIKVRLKVEDKTDPTKSCETEATFTSATNTWQTLEFNFNNQATGTAPFNQAYTFNKASIFFNFGTTGAIAGERIYYFDDVKFGPAVAGPALPVLPLDFESATINYAFTDFDGGATTKIANPQINGINTSANVARMIKSTGQPWGGSWIQLAGPIDFSVNKTFKAKIYSPRIGAKVLLKVENATNPALNFEKEVLTTVANAWEDLTFDYSTINTANAYHKIVFIFDNGTMGNGTANFTWLIDDVRLVAAAPVLTQMNLPVTFDVTTVNYGLVGFGGAEQSTITTDPTLATNKVAKVIKTNTAELWAGTTITALSGVTQTGFGSNIPFNNCDTKMSVRVWSPHASIKVRLKVEDKLDPTKSCETEATVTTASGWQTLTFDFANQVTATAPLNFAYNYNKASIFFNFGVMGAVAGERIYYFDDVMFVNTGAPAAPTVSTISYCQNSTASALTATIATGNTAKWYTTPTGGTATAAPTPPTLATGTTNYYVSQATALGCESPRALLAVTINSTPVAPVVVNPVAYCQNTTTQLLSATALAGNNLKWYTTPTAGVASTTTPLPTATTAGTTNYYVSQSNGIGCESPRSLIAVTVAATPTVPTLSAPVTMLAPGISTTITAANTSIANTLQWYKNGLLVSGQSGLSIPVDVNSIGSYSLKVTNASGCVATSNNLLIETLGTTNLFAYPSPSTGNFQVRYYSDITNLKPRKLVIYSALGELVYSANFAMFAAYTPMHINISNQATGYYTIYLLDSDGKKLASEKVLLKK